MLSSIACCTFTVKGKNMNPISVRKPITTTAIIFAPRRHRTCTSKACSSKAIVLEKQGELCLSDADFFLKRREKQQTQKAVQFQQSSLQVLLLTCPLPALVRDVLDFLSVFSSCGFPSSPVSVFFTLIPAEHALTGVPSPQCFSSWWPIPKGIKRGGAG